MWDMPVGNTMALCNTQHTGKEILRRPMSVYFANDPDCVVLLCGVQGSNHTLLVPDSYVHLCTLYRETLGRMDVQDIFFVYTPSPQKQSHRIFCTLLFRTDEIL